MRFVFLFFCSVLFSSAQQRFSWSENYKLHYEDFQGPIPANETFIKATTAAVIEVSFEQVGNMVHVTVINYFKKNESWMMNEAKIEYALNHEQGHFDIAEIYARKIRKKLQETKLNPHKNGAEITKIFEKIGKKHLQAQKKYDKATSYSIKEKNQKEWTKKIADELKELEAYKEPLVKMPFK